MDQKKFTQIAVILVAAVWAFCGSFMISAKIIKDKKAESTTIPIQTTAPFTATTAAPTTTSPSTEKSTTGFFTIDGNNVSTTIKVGDPQWLIDEQASIEASKKAEEEAKNTTKSIVPEGKKNIINAYVDGINKLKDTKNMTVSKASTLDFSVDKIFINGTTEASNKTVLDFISNALNSNKPADLTYVFENGTDKQTGQTPITAIAPLGSYAKLENSAVKSAKAQKTVGDGYRITIELEDEVQTHDKAAPNHATTVEVIDVAGLTPAGANLNYLNITYSGTVIEATFDKNERIVSVKHKLPVSKADGEGSMNIPFLGTNSASMEMHGEYNCTYTVEY